MSKKKSTYEYFSQSKVKVEVSRTSRRYSEGEGGSNREGRDREAAEALDQVCQSIDRTARDCRRLLRNEHADHVAIVNNEANEAEDSKAEDSKPEDKKAEDGEASAKNLTNRKFECPVCKEIPTNRKIFSCEDCHNWICGGCLEELKRFNPLKCPLCRYDLNDNPMKRNKTVERLIA